MDKLFDAAPKIIAESSKSPLGIVSLSILALSVLGYLFFREASDMVRVSMFALMFFGYGLLNFSLIRTARLPLPEQPGKADAEPSPVELPAASSPAATTQYDSETRGLHSVPQAAHLPLVPHEWPAACSNYASDGLRQVGGKAASRLGLAGTGSSASPFDYHRRPVLRRALSRLNCKSGHP